jgi:serine/threonine protein kinase
VTDAIREVYHLQNLRHFHIVQPVETYLQGRNFSVLMYPVADTHLGRFLEDTLDTDMWISFKRREFLASTLSCLTSAMAFIHQHKTKHMNIKPQNILVRRVHISIHEHGWRIYIADFGLSRSIAPQDHSETDGPMSRTPRYCAPEVYSHEKEDDLHKSSRFVACSSKF